MRQTFGEQRKKRNPRLTKTGEKAGSGGRGKQHECRLGQGSAKNRGQESTCSTGRNETGENWGDNPLREKKSAKKGGNSLAISGRQEGGSGSKKRERGFGIFSSEERLERAYEKRKVGLEVKGRGESESRKGVKH